jgi:hypothetical protein
MNKNKDLEIILSITLGFLELYLLFKIDILLLLAFGIGIIGLFSNYLREKIVLSKYTVN